MTMIHVVGIGLDGAAGLSEAVRHVVATATLLVGSARHLRYFPDHPAPQLQLGDLAAAIAQMRQALAMSSMASIVVLTSGDPLFFGLGRLLLQEFAPEQLTFHPHLSSVQLAFNRVKVPWQEARIVSVHGRSLDELIPLFQQGVSPLAILTDPTHSPSAIARLMAALDLPSDYRIWVCENLGGPDERITMTTSDKPDLEVLTQQPVAPLNVMVLQRLEVSPLSDRPTYPLIGMPDSAFASFPDRPGLMTKREVRVLALAELALQPHQVVWDVGAGTGSVAIELARLCPTAQIYAIEKTAMGQTLIQQNCQRFQVDSVQPIAGAAPDAVRSLPDPDRVFIGGSGGQLIPILEACSARLTPEGRMVLALTTLEHLAHTLAWAHAPAQADQWQVQCLQVHLSRSVPIASLTRWSPLNPVTLVTFTRTARSRTPLPP